MRYLRLQRSQANRRRSERDADRTGSRTEPVQSDPLARGYPAPAEPAPVAPAASPRKLKSG
ncbi:MAG: hypothetical protein B7Z51_06075 [Methyloversatilis sp. 12-65-5]|nr:MAG: hypothetical protein B7Z51_06075 [Methyloversatilis sp. 12-65-5]